MRQFLTTVILTFTALGAAVASTNGNGTVNVNGTSPALCNCTKLTPEIQACHSSTLEIEVGGEFLKLKTGYSDSVCITVDLPPETCVYYRYNYTCTQSGGIFSSQFCKLTSASIQTRATTDADCDDDAK